MVLIIASVVALVLIGIGIAIGLVACGLTVLLLGIGVISSSIFVGFLSGRPATGLRVLFLQCGILAGIPAGAACAWLGQKFFAVYGSDFAIMAYGAIGGALAGVVIALMLDFIFRRLQVWASQRLLPVRTETMRVIGRYE